MRPGKGSAQQFGKNRASYFRHRRRLALFFWPLQVAIAVLASGITPRLLGAPSAVATVRGTISSIGPNGEPFNIPGVSLQLSGAALGQGRLETLSNDTGEYNFSELPAGSFTLEASLPGFKRVVSTITMEAGQTIDENIRLELEELHEKVTVEATPEDIDTKAVAPAAEFKQDTLQTVPLVDDRFQDALPLVPGVVRGPDGSLNLKGARASQSGLVVNNANVVDAATGESVINVPLDVIQSLQVVTNPYAAEYGKFTGALTSIETGRGTDKWQVRPESFLPRFRRRGGSWAGVQSFTPRLTFSVPLKNEKVKLLQSFEYRFDRNQIEVGTLPARSRDTVQESFNSFTQFDWDIDATNHLTTSFTLFPHKLGFANLNTFNPQEVTANVKRRGFSWGINERKVLSSGSLLESYFSITRNDANIFPSSGDGVLNFAPNVNSGSFFNRQDRETSRYEALEAYSFTPAKFAGSHLMKVAAGFNYNTFDGRNQSNMVRILRADGTRSQQIDFVGNTLLQRNKTEYLSYFQDKWNANDRLTLEYGVRYDRDTIADENGVAPRLGFAFLPFRDGKTVLRGGVGLFYDKVTFNVATFEQLQERVLTQFAADGSQVIGAPRVQRFVVDKGEFRTPRSVNANIELDREWLENLFVRVGYQQREGRREYVLDPMESPTLGSVLQLSNSGNARYKEFQVTARYKFRQTDQVVASYVRSAVTGDLNDFNPFFGSVENPIIQPNERSRLPWDAPNRFLVWGDLRLRYGFTVSPVLDIHDGFPLSIVDEDRNFVGPRNRAGRFPTFASLDLQILKTVKVPVLRKKTRIGLKIFNLTNHFNPRDFQSNLASPSFGGFFNGVGRKFGGKFVVNF